MQTFPVKRTTAKKTQKIFYNLYTDGLKEITKEHLTRKIMIYCGTNKLTITNYIDHFLAFKFISEMDDGRYKINYKKVENFISEVFRIEQNPFNI